MRARSMAVHARSPTAAIPIPGDPIQAFWVRAERRAPYALHRLQCAKGGMLELVYENTALVSLTYRSPTDIGALPATRAADASHA